MSCNSCSNITLPGVVGPAGAAGAAGAAGNGIVSVSFQSTTNPGGTPTVAGYTDTYRITYTDATTFDYNIVNGTVGSNGTNGTTLLQTLTSASSDITSATYASAISGPWVVPYNTLNTNGDTLRLQAQSMITLSDASNGGMQVRVGTTTAGIQNAQIGISYLSAYDYPNYAVRTMSSIVLELDIVRVSSTSIRIESKLTDLIMDSVESNYSTEMISSGLKSREIAKSSQVIPVDDLTTAGGNLSVDVLLKTDDITRPIKLLYGKLYLLNK